jgi:hypothetical protein
LNLEDDELNLPRLPEESPRPCPLCLINRGWNPVSNSINSTENRPPSATPVTAPPSASGNAPNPDTQTSYKKGYSLTKRQKSSNNDFSTGGEKAVSTTTRPTLTGKLVAKLKSEVKLVQHESNSETESEVTLGDGEASKMSSANKFLKVKLSTTELEQHHRGFAQQQQQVQTNELSSTTENANFSFVNMQRHSSLASGDKFLIKDSFNTSEEDEDDESDSSSEVDDVFANEKHTATKLLVKKQENMRVSGAKLREKLHGRVAQMPSGPNAIKRRTNYSLSNVSNYNLRSHSVNAQKKVYPGAMLQLVPKD